MRLLLVNLLLGGLIAFPSMASASEPFAVVELFASEGCSSCPPADELLRQIARTAREQNKRIFPLSFQVDYWNNLGWIDPFSKPEFTQRQYTYANALQTSSVYTPQMIINGVDAFVGSDSAKAQKTIEQALRKNPGNGISLKISGNNSGQIKIGFSCEHGQDNAVIHFALVERALESRPTDGENAGSLLKHDNIVREFQTIPFKQEGEISFKSPSPQDLSHFAVIGYIQSAKSMHILAADGLDF